MFRGPAIGTMRSSHDDFPFYDGRPVNIEAKGWLVILVSVIGAFMILTLTPRFSFPSDLLPAMLFVAIPLLIARGRWLSTRSGSTEAELPTAKTMATSTSARSSAIAGKACAPKRQSAVAGQMPVSRSRSRV